MSTTLDPKRIRIDLDTQSRVSLNDEVVKEYADAMEAGHEFPPILVYYDEVNDDHILADGFHRYAAHIKLRPNDPISVELKLGTVEDAQWESIGANKSHGLRRTNEDKRNATKLALLHRNGVKKSNVQIAEHVGVHEVTVRRVRAEFESTSALPKSNERIGRDGRVINTSAIGEGSKRENASSAQTSRKNSSPSGIHFGKKAPPPGSTCSNCLYFEDGHCTVDETEPLPWNEACDDWDLKVEDKPNKKMPPPDYGNLTPYVEKDKKPQKTNPHQYRRLKGCLNVSLPPDNPQLFAVELRNRFSPDYLTACIAALKHILLDTDD